MARPMVRLSDSGATFVPGEMEWPFPDMLVVGFDEELLPLWAADATALDGAWMQPARLYRKQRESQLGPEVDGMEHVLRGAEYDPLDDVETYSWRFPEFKWAEPIKVVRSDGSAGGFFCRICIARDGLSADQIEGSALSKGDAIAHIEREHRSGSKGE